MYQLRSLILYNIFYWHVFVGWMHYVGIFALNYGKHTKHIFIQFIILWHEWHILFIIYFLCFFFFWSDFLWIRFTFIRKCDCSSHTEDKCFVIYTIISFGLPLLSVVVTRFQGKLGIPIYYIKGIHNYDMNRVNDLYFILPVAFLLTTCLCLLLMIFYVFNTNQPILPNKTVHLTNSMHQMISNVEQYEKVKQT